MKTRIVSVETYKTYKGTTEVEVKYIPQYQSLFLSLYLITFGLVKKYFWKDFDIEGEIGFILEHGHYIYDKNSAKDFIDWYIKKRETKVEVVKKYEDYP